MSFRHIAYLVVLGAGCGLQMYAFSSGDKEMLLPYLLGILLVGLAMMLTFARWLGNVTARRPVNPMLSCALAGAVAGPIVGALLEQLGGREAARALFEAYPRSMDVVFLITFWGSIGAFLGAAIGTLRKRA